MYNTIVAMGHLVKDPESRQTNTGKTICTFRMCISDSNAKNKCFIDVETWERTAEVCMQYLKKGREVMIDGELNLSAWTGKDGSSQNKVFIKADKVKFLNSGSKKDSDQESKPSKTKVEHNDDSSEDEIPF